MPGSPRSSQGALLEGPGHPLLPVRTASRPPLPGDASRHVSSLQEELGSGEGVSSLLLRSSTAGEGGGPGVVLQADEGVAPGGVASAAALAAAQRPPLPLLLQAQAQAQAQAAGQAAGQVFSPPNSPRRRQTTFGATLDFVETLCQASASLTAFQRARAAPRRLARLASRRALPAAPRARLHATHCCRVDALPLPCPPLDLCSRRPAVGAAPRAAADQRRD